MSVSPSSTTIWPAAEARSIGALNGIEMAAGRVDALGGVGRIRRADRQRSDAERVRAELVAGEGVAVLVGDDAVAQRELAQRAGGDEVDRVRDQRRARRKGEMVAARVEPAVVRDLGAAAAQHEGCDSARLPTTTPSSSIRSSTLGSISSEKKRACQPTATRP